MASVESNWASLPSDIVNMILDKLFPFSEYVRFSSVCKSYLFVAAENNAKHQQRMKNTCGIQLPLLLIPTKDNSAERRSLYSFTDDKICDFQFSVPFNRRCSGSSHGWLATIDKTKAVTLRNPVSGRTICLPPIKQVWNFSDYEEDDLELYDSDEDFDAYEYDLLKVILSAQPTEDTHYEVAAIYGEYRTLALVKSGEKDWTYVKNKRNVLVDVIYYKGQVLAVDRWGGLETIDASSSISTSEPSAKMVAPRTSVHAPKAYLVESSAGDLLMVQRFLKQKDHKIQLLTSGFKIFKLQHSTATATAGWIEIKSLGDDALFLGDNHSLCISVANVTGCKSNSIYYTDDYDDATTYEAFGPRDMGVFNLEDASFGLHYKLDPSQKHMPPALWIVPTLPKFGSNLSSSG